MINIIRQGTICKVRMTADEVKDRAWGFAKAYSSINKQYLCRFTYEYQVREEWIDEDKVEIIPRGD